MKCEMPFCSGVSRREPAPIQIPTETERTCGMVSVITRTPLASVVISISRAGVVGAVMLWLGGESYIYRTTFGTAPPGCTRAMVDRRAQRAPRLSIRAMWDRRFRLSI